jgi:hypothetical protein
MTTSLTRGSKPNLINAQRKTQENAARKSALANAGKRKLLPPLKCEQGTKS